MSSGILILRRKEFVISFLIQVNPKNQSLNQKREVNKGSREEGRTQKMYIIHKGKNQANYLSEPKQALSKRQKKVLKKSIAFCCDYRMPDFFSSTESTSEVREVLEEGGRRWMDVWMGDEEKSEDIFVTPEPPIEGQGSSEVHIKCTGKFYLQLRRKTGAWHCLWRTVSFSTACGCYSNGYRYR